MLKRIAAWLAENGAGVFALVCLIGLGVGIGWECGWGWGIALPCGISFALLVYAWIKSDVEPPKEPDEDETDDQEQ